MLLNMTTAIDEKGVLIKPVEFLEDLLNTVRTGTPDHETVGLMSAHLENIERFYNEAVHTDHIGLFFNELPNFDELKIGLNYFLATNPNSKVNVKGYIKAGDLASASMFLEKYMIRASQEPREEDPQNIIGNKLLQSSQFLATVRDFMTGDGYEVFEKELNSDVDLALLTSQKYLCGVLNLTGGKGFEGLGEDITNLAAVRNHEGVEATIAGLINDDKVIEAFKRTVDYIQLAEFAYGTSEDVAQLYAESLNLCDYETRLNEAIANAESRNETLEKREEKADKKGRNGNRFSKRAREAKEKSDEALDDIKAIKAEFAEKIMDLKHNIDSYSNEGHYAGKLKKLVDKTKKKFGYADYSKTLATSEDEITQLLKNRGYEKRAEGVIDQVKKTWTYFTGTLNTAEIDADMINFGYLTAIENKAEYRKILAERVLNMRLANAGVQPEDVELRDKAKRVLDLVVHPTKKEPSMYTTEIVLAKADKLLQDAPDIPRQREMAYASAQQNIGDYERVVSEVEKALKASWVNDKTRNEERTPALQRALVSVMGYQENQNAPGTCALDSYNHFFPYAAAFFPAEKIGIDEAPDFAELLRVDGEGLAKKIKEQSPRIGWGQKIRKAFSYLYN